MTTELHLDRALRTYGFAVAADGWLRRSGGPNKGVGLMLRKVVITAIDQCSRYHKAKIWYCPSADDTGTLVETTLGFLEGTIEEVIALANYINANASKWMP